MSKLTASKLLSHCRQALARWLGPQPPRDPEVQEYLATHPWLAWVDRRLVPARSRPLPANAKAR